MATSKSRKLNILCIMFKIIAFFVAVRSVMTYYMCVENICMRAPLQYEGGFWVIQLAIFSFMCLYQTRKVSSHVYVC